MNDAKIIEALKIENKKLKAENAELEKRKKYGLVWEDKPEIFDKQSQCAYPILRGKDDKKYPNISQQTDGDNNQKPHILIEGDNYHTLSVLNVTHQNKIDVIYIDPPYNTGAKDWKYNNDFVDKEDKFRHSKWLSFMAKRLELAKNLLTDDGVLICTIDKHEQANLGVLLQEIFNDYETHCITIVHNPRGVQGNNFSYTNEYAFFVFKTKLKVIKKIKREKPLEEEFKDHGGESLRTNAKNCFYPIFVKNNRIIGFGDVSNNGFHPTGKTVLNDDGSISVYPIDTSGTERKWVFARQSINQIKDKLFVKSKNNGEIDIFRIKDERAPKTVWDCKRYDASTFGSKIVNDILPEYSFDYPKSLNAVYDSIYSVISDKKNAVVLDFFAGSGTTAHAVLELNKTDGGNRQCILATNNENGICENITYERVKRVIEGYTTPKGKQVAGLGGELHYLKTDFVPKDDIKSISDDDKIAFSHQVGVMLALKENTFNEVDSNNHYQIFSSNEKITGIYFSENIDILDELLNFLNKQNLPCYLYAYPELDEADFKDGNITLSEIPEHILQIYQTIGVI